MLRRDRRAVRAPFPEPPPEPLREGAPAQAPVAAQATGKMLSNLSRFVVFRAVTSLSLNVVGQMC